MPHDHDHDHAHADHHDHDHDHAHGHAHGLGGHSHAPASFGRAFAIGASANTAFVMIQIVYGLSAGSMALLADGLHNLGDVLGLLAAWAAMGMGRWLPTARHTYGWGRSSILAALLNAVVLLLGCGAIAIEALQRFGQPAVVGTATVMWVAALGILVNGGSALLFMKGSKEDLNVRGAFLHLASDAAVSLGVVLAAFAIRLTGWAWIDPATSLVIIAVITWSTWGLLRQSTELAMDAVPRGVDEAAVRAALAGLPAVAEVHDLHIWALSTTQNAATAHLVSDAPGPGLVEQACALLHDRFRIDHATVQIEAPDHAARCRLRPAAVV